jgi:hypothetical protein
MPLADSILQTYQDISGSTAAPRPFDQAVFYEHITAILFFSWPDGADRRWLSAEFRYGSVGRHTRCGYPDWKWREHPAITGDRPYCPFSKMPFSLPEVCRMAML